MKALLVVTDLFATVGGGQTIYRRIIEASPTVEFTYLLEREPEDAPRPRNARGVRLPSRRRVEVLSAPPFAAYRQAALRDADRVARAVAGRSFDIVDVPDYLVFGAQLRDAFDRHGVGCERLVLAMHGSISRSMAMNWGSQDVLEEQALEREQFVAADDVYAISPAYIQEWQAIARREVHFLDPVRFISPAAPALAPATAEPAPDLCCIGRMERRKGNDLFVELVRWLRPKAYREAMHIGDDDYSRGIASSKLLADIARRRGVSIASRPSLDPAGLAALFRSRAAVVLPVRYDSLNLIALEALFSGCPVAVSTRAGVCAYLDAAHPHLPYLKIDLGDLYASVAALETLLDGYDQTRERLVAALGAVRADVGRTPDFAEIYGRMLDRPSPTAQAASAPATAVAAAPRRKVEYRDAGPSPVALLTAVGASATRRMLGEARFQSLRAFVRNPRTQVRQVLKRTLFASRRLGDARLAHALLDAVAIPRRLRQVAAMHERSPADIRQKLRRIYAAAASPVLRCNFWRDIARLERVLGNELVAVAYELRVLRLVGDDRHGLLAGVVRTLRQLGFPHESDAAEAMYADPARSLAAVRAYLDDAYRRHLSWAEKPFAAIDDRRTGRARVAVIVSLYRAAPKLRFFLSSLRHQTLIARGEVELVLVDSGSPTDERAVFERLAAERPLNAVYARSAARETIQAAWNRGIALARAPYLVFLGVDELLYPEALETLAAELDAHPAVDWVMSDSIVTEVDNEGVLKDDVMTYARSGAGKDHVYLETCYLSYVGGMYRRTLHERFGYYDEAFSGAGDTEFKNRILPRINVRFVPRPLGLFLNYPDERTTASPKAEIEDLRAWYLHRTAGGVDYAFADRPVGDAERLLATALGYRKSFCGHLSSDVEYAMHLARHVLARDPGASRAAETLRGLETMLADLRALEYTDRPRGGLGCRALILRARAAAMAQQERHRALWGTDAVPTYAILNDNRFEQHSWLWKTVPEVP